MVSAFTIRPALISDSEEIHQCLRVAFAHFLNSYSREAFSDTVPTVENVRQRFTSMSLFVAEDGGRKVIPGVELPAGIYHSTLAHCVIGNDALIRDASRKDSGAWSRLAALQAGQARTRLSRRS